MTNDPPGQGQDGSALERLRHLHAALVDQLEQPVAVLDTESLRIVDANAAFLRAVARPRDEAVGVALSSLVPGDADFVRALLDLDDAPVRLADQPLSVGDDAHLYDLTLRAVALEDGRPAVLLAAVDVTERRQLQARMLEMDRMIAIGTLAAGVGHEINNPLSYVTANLDFGAQTIANGLPLLRRAIQRLERCAAVGAEDDEATEQVRAQVDVLDRLIPQLLEVKDALGDASEGARRVRDVVKDLRRLSSWSDEQSVELVSVERTLESSLNIAWNQIKHRARLSRDFAAAVPLVLANPSRLGQVFLNLLVNAAQAIPAGAYEDNEIRLVTRSADGHVVVEVHDTGEGMTAEVRARIFEPFFSTKRKSKGTGLGLAICQSIVGAMDGRIEVDSEPGVGSTFRVVLPAAPYTPTSTSTSEAEDGDVDRQIRALVIDDEPRIGDVFERMLGDGFEVRTATTGAEAFALLDAEPVDVIFCDVLMPQLSGKDVYEHIAANQSALADRIIFMTGGAFTLEMDDFLESIDNPCLTKPVDFPAAARCARRLVDDRS